MVRNLQFSGQRVSVQASPASLEEALETVLLTLPMPELSAELAVNGVKVYPEAVAAMLPGWCGLWLMDLGDGDEPLVVEGPRGERMAAGRFGGALCAALANAEGTEVTLLCGELGTGRLQEVVPTLLFAALQAAGNDDRRW